MIKVEKGSTIPKKLSDDGVAQTAINCAEYNEEPDKYRSGVKKFSIRRNIYNHKSVKRALKKYQHDKCCYCEGKFTANYAGDVEHFRPKHYAQQAYGTVKEYPGYYWLAYDWTNLFFSCAICNSSHKKNLFPLVDSSGRARDHHGSLEQEQPLLLDTGGTEDPRNHIGFHKEVPVKITENGRVTIENLGLDRPGLNEDRRKLLAQLKLARDVVNLFGEDPRPDAQQVVGESRGLLNAAVKPDAKFSSMAQDLLAEGG